MLTLDVLIATHRQEGIDRVAKMNLPVVDGVRYIVSWQNDGADNIPENLSKRDDVKILFNPGKGLSQNRNFSLNHAEGDILLIADDDLNYHEEGLRLVQKAFEDDLELDIGLFRYTNQDYKYEKIYPDHICVLGDPYPKGYYPSSIEIAIRRHGRAKKLRFSELLGIGAPVLKCGEESFYIYEASKIGCKIKLFPVELCVHHGETTGNRSVTDPGVYKGMGAITSLLYPYSYPIRFFIMAFRGQRNGKMKFLPAIYNFFQGVRYIRSKDLHESSLT